MPQVIARAQRSTAKLAYVINRGKKVEKEINWVVGPIELANMVASIANATPGSYSVNLMPHQFYPDVFDYTGPSRSMPWSIRMIAEAWKFGKLSAQARGFVYVGAVGYLRGQSDAREFEFSFLKKRGRGLCCIFTGNDIRSVTVMSEQERKLGIPNVATYLPALSPIFASAGYDLERRRTAEVAERYADVIFSSRNDQAGYLRRETLPFLYFFPEKQIADSRDKFQNIERLVVLHAPSSPIIKGTQLVRAAVAALQEEGLDFEYLELSGVPHGEVTAALQRAHIVLNQFYAYMPGVFGIEAMAAGTVMLTSADEGLEPDLPINSNSAWIVTHHHQVTDHLRQALAMTGTELHAQALVAQQWVRDNATDVVSGRTFRKILETVSGD